MTITEKVAYLRGLCEGMAIDENTNEGRLFGKIIDVLEDMAYSIVDVEDGLNDVTEQIEEIDEDLDALEEDYYGEEDSEEEACEVTCPSCGEKICVDFETLSEGEIDCPNCGEHLEFDLDECDCECGCEDCAAEHKSEKE